MRVQLSADVQGQDLGKELVQVRNSELGPMGQKSQQLESLVLGAAGTEPVATWVAPPASAPAFDCAGAEYWLLLAEGGECEHARALDAVAWPR